MTSDTLWEHRITANHRFNHNECSWFCILHIEENLSRVSLKESIPLHYTSKPTQINLSPPFWVNSKVKFWFRILAWPLACKLEWGRENMHNEKEHCTNLFYYVYLCKWNLNLFKEILLLLLLRPGQYFNPEAVHEQQWWIEFINCGLIKAYWREKSTKLLLFPSAPAPKILDEALLKHSLSQLMNSECLLIRCISLSLPYHPPVILSLISYMHINDLLLYSCVHHQFTVLVRLLAFLLLLHNFIS